MNYDDNNPYASPLIPASDSPPPPPPLTTAEIQRRLFVPAVGMIATTLLTGILALLGLPVAIELALLAIQNKLGAQQTNEVAVGAIIVTAEIAMGLLVIRGAMAMLQVRDRDAAIKAAVLAMVPCNFTCILAAPFGLWAISILLNARVRAGFREGKVRWLSQRFTTGRAVPPA